MIGALEQTIGPDAHKGSCHVRWLKFNEAGRIFALSSQRASRADSPTRPERTYSPLDRSNLFVHSPTLIIVAALFSALIAGVLYSVWYFNRGIPGLRLWTWSFFAMGTFALNLLLRDFMSQGIALVLAQLSIVASAYLCWLGSRAYMGRKPLSLSAQVSVGVCGAVFLLLSAYFTHIKPNPGARFVLISVFLGFFFLETARTMARGGMHRVPARYLFACVVGGHGVFLLVRPLLFQLAVPSSSIGADNRLVTLMSQFVVLESTVAVVLVAFGVLMLTNEFITTELRRLAEIDPLTHVFNRRAFLLLLDKALSNSQRTQAPLPVLLIDLDHFKVINDTWGHRAGDDVLKHFVQLSNRCLRKEDVMGRLGGEEFAIFLPNADGPGAAAVAERLRALVESQSMNSTADARADIRLTVSIGVVLCWAGESGEAVLQRADQAMYLAKQRGRNRVELRAGDGLAERTPGMQAHAATASLA